ncbi:MAG: hypothetical protein R6U04_00360 [Bacteroidales bacterium]
MNNIIKYSVLIGLMSIIASPVYSQESILINHHSIVLDKIPMEWVDSAKANLHIGYGHTSHGSQLATGMNALKSYFSDGRFDWSNSDVPGNLHMFEGDLWSQDGWLGLDCGADGWDDETREYLDAHPDCNVIIWSWCGYINTVVDRNVLTHYLQPMNQLESEYPDVKFVYMTGPLDGSGPEGDVKKANDSIRQYCYDNNKILYDFADIESYDPDGLVNYMEYGANDECDYDPDGEEPYDRTENWAANWVNDNPDDILTSLTNSANSGDCDFGHTHCLNCVMKGIAAWHLWTKIAGWEDTADTTHISTFIVETGLWEEPANWDNGVPDSSTAVIIPARHHANVTTNVRCNTITIEPDGVLTISDGNTISAVSVKIESDKSSSNTGRVYNYGILEANETTVEKFTEGNKWMNISSPLTNGLYDAFNTSANELYHWNIETGDYETIETNSEQLIPMLGYLFKHNGNDTTIAFNGDLNHGEQSINLEINEEDTLYKGWNLSGNPYTVPLDWTMEGWDKTNIANSIYLQNTTGGQPCSYVNGYRNPAECPDGVIAPMSTFWIFTHQEGSFSVNNDAMTYSATSKRKGYKQSEKFIRLRMLGPELSYETLFILGNATGLSHNFDFEFDALHLPVPAKNLQWSPGLYSLDSNQTKISIYNAPDTGSFHLRMGYIVTEAEDYSIEILEANNMPDTIYLADIEQNNEVILTKTPYYFYSETGMHNQRFVLSDTSLFGNSTSLQSEKKPEEFIVYTHEGNIFIKNKEPLYATVKIINILGITEYENKHYLNGRESIPFRKKGYFILMIKSKGKTLNYKILL